MVLSTLLCIALIYTSHSRDRELLDDLRLHDNAAATQIADFVSEYTSDLTLAVPLSLTFWIVGAIGNRAKWRRLGLACLMATLTAGLAVTLVKRVTGRPRPNAANHFPDDLYGPTTASKLHSFPSGHTGTSTATGVTVMAGSPLLIVPGAVYAATVGYSRMQLRKHYPLDIVGGGIIGFICGACFASTVPGSMIRLRRKKRTRIRSADGL